MKFGGSVELVLAFSYGRNRPSGFTEHDIRCSVMTVFNGMLQFANTKNHNRRSPNDFGFFCNLGRFIRCRYLTLPVLHYLKVVA